MPDDSESNKPKRKVLDLIDEKKSPSRRERQRAEAAQRKTVEDAKKEAYDPFAEEKKPKVRKTQQSGKPVLPTISKLLEEEDPSMVKMPAVAAPVPVASDEAPAPEVVEESKPKVSDDKVISVKPPIVVSELATMMGLKPFQLLADLIKLQVFVAPHQAIEPDIAALVCEQHGYVFEREKREKGGGVHKVEEVIVEPEAPADEPEEALKLRPPIITIMGHVDHGKTTLLDRIRKSRITASEAGGITQHIGAYKIEHDGKPVTFIDTPGHAIFSSMRARGADITDIVVLVVAANDGLMPQTLEAIAHAKKAQKTIIVAINKCDLESANPMHVKSQLAERGLQTTDFGGDTECVEISALNGKGVDELLDLLALQAEVLELKANPKGHARASIIEAKYQQGRGAVASVIVESGTLRTGKPFICGPFAGKVKALINDRGEAIKEATPGTPVEVIGFEELPRVGDSLVEMENDRTSKKLAGERQEELRAERLKVPQKSRMEDLLAHAHDGGAKAILRLILKTDVQGSVEAIRNAVLDIESDKVDVNFLSAAAGPITEGDVQLASSSDAVVIGFNIKVEAKAARLAKAEGVQIKLYSVVYELIDQVREAMLGLLEPETREKIIGHAEVKQVFKVLRGRAAGCYVKDGKVHRKAHARVIRDGVPVFDGKMSTLRRFQDEVQEVKNGIECGIRLGDFNEYLEGDIIECYELEKIPQTL
ncbi:translation initiation factor IF-2 [Haloferula luteola]|uniref:Translation initiation factor IF-2 n=1 Tax=Haloferula luteola TaxID=595692 RepID=A0A840V176_9BACT|nr:translation initiation factor IF-2 [Haloferula luteola]MBB5351752.1 translation initiation factor IF-2 [Haloferula luteola]